MKKIIILGLLTIIGVSIAIFFVFREDPKAVIPLPPVIENPSPVFPIVPEEIIIPPVNSEEKIKVLIKSSMFEMPLINIGSTTISANYALQLWYDENIGGEALLRFDNSTGWQVVSLGGGAWSVDTLVEQGVPRSVAVGLVENRTY